MKYYTLIMLSLALLILAGCTVTGNVVQETDAATEATLKNIEVMIHSSDDVDVPSNNEVQLYLTNGGFSPSVIEANVGQTIVVTSYYVDDVYFAIDELEVLEPLREADTFEFTVEKAGEYPYVCLDCSPMLKGTLIVN